MQVVVLTLLYSWAGLGIAIVNDFKSVSHSSYIELYDCMLCYCAHRGVCILSRLTAALAVVQCVSSSGSVNSSKLCNSSAEQ
jgi:hypothetical protein